MKRIAIIGGGIAGLSAAYYLEKARRAGAPINYSLFEASPRLGGIICSERCGDFLIEGGADSFLSEKPWARHLCCELNLEDQLIGSNDVQRKTYILANGRLQPLPAGLQFIVPASIDDVNASPIFSDGAKAQIAKEVEMQPRCVNQEKDESVASFVQRHFGQEFVEKLAEPMLAGVFGGECSRLSAPAVLPRFVEMERTHGSLLRCLQILKVPPQIEARWPIFTTLKNGMQQLPEAITARLNANWVCTGCTVESARFNLDHWQLMCNGRLHDFDAVILAVPAQAAANILSNSREISECLGKIPYTSSVAVALAFSGEALAKQHFELPPGFGFLVPRAEGRRILACTFVQQKFAHRASAGGILLRVFLGGARDEAVLALDDKQIIVLVREELRSVLGLQSVPEYSRIFRWPKSMPQYDVGHLELIAKIEQIEKQMPELAFIGSAYRGIGVPDCVREGREAALKLLQ